MGICAFLLYSFISFLSTCGFYKRKSIGTSQTSLMKFQNELHILLWTKNRIFQTVKKCKYVTSKGICMFGNSKVHMSSFQIILIKYSYLRSIRFHSNNYILKHVLCVSIPIASWCNSHQSNIDCGSFPICILLMLWHNAKFVRNDFPR